MAEIRKTLSESIDAHNENWIDSHRYFELALSTRKLWRCDRPSQGISGLEDPETGERFLIRSEKLEIQVTLDN